jgi:hypothetical protein
MLGFVSKNEVIKRMGKFQAFGECLHNVALIRYKVRTDFYGDRERKDRFKPQQGIKQQEKAKTIVCPLRMFAVFCTDITNDRISIEIW